MNTSIRQRHKWAANRFLTASLLAAAMTIGPINIASAENQPVAKEAGLTTLITATPEAGFALAVTLSKKGVATTQTDPAIRKSLRPIYAHDPDSLIAVSHVVATHFQTIAAANNYWRK